ncbi:tumor necrosis factor receptor superfamily member 6B isoform X2 [Callorhinchus milii]|uniref:tumor necrosis factor receptor superfamily member 6B isoform X2 n=1 Tax=Callorhinchus milii TaxID=7868 RepID=UPI000457509E|nr:tumor necrosis factor receptor superfamily member 6B isoform X2 [Callorhinchus milii]|eukprot:gi/632939372/ref/XP_007909806.1/ PREDICTED: tumor necrosis factor receptor superfamily member 6B isoform X2 [Callorhinchus milii]
MMLKYVINIALVAVISRLCTANLTYQRRDAATGQMVTCEQCPPGTFVKTHCTSVQRTVCEGCPQLHYTQYWNYLMKCRYCNVFCAEHQYEKHQCNATHNRVCECKAGYYLDFQFCLKHSSCPPSYGVAELGTAYADTKCEKCSKTSFSSTSSSTETCIAHRNCTAQDLEVNVPGDRHHDTLCTPCKKHEDNNIFANTSAVSICDEAMIEFVAYQKIPQRKLKRFIFLLRIQNTRQFRKELQGHGKPEIYEILHSLLLKWKEGIKENVLENMTDILKKAKLKSIEMKVRERFM